ncbi:MAG: hypothetical protein WCX77_04210 [Candidatus Paceibacterota bacterium]|jgi:hypothetical protein
MENDIKKIAAQIKSLVDELAALANASNPKGQSTKKKVRTAEAKGAIGALNLLAEEGFFDTPKDISLVMGKLKEIGRYYPQPAVSMNLLNLTRRRIFTRIPDKETKNWLYVIKK